MKKLLTAAEILAAQDIEHRFVEVPEWGGTVRVKGLTGAERDAFEGGIVRLVQGGGKGKKKRTEQRVKVDMKDARAKLCALAMVDDNDARLFSDEQTAALGGKSGKALARVYDVAAELAGLTDEDMEELLGN